MSFEEGSSSSPQLHPELSPMNTSAPATPPSNNLRSRQTAWWQSSVVRRSSSAVDEAVDELTEKSQFLLRKSPRSSLVSTASNSTCSHSTCSSQLHNNNYVPTSYEEEGEEDEQGPAIALFHRNEIQVGQLLGEGTFCCVYEVTGFDLKNIDNNEDDDETDSPCTMAHLRQDVVANGVLLAEGGGEESTTTTTTTTSYALKHLKPDLLTSTKDFEQAATDIVMEAKYLSALDHPGILKLRGLAFGGTAAFQNSGHHDGYFLLTDRLVGTLAQRIEQWKQQQSENNYDHTSSLACKAQYALQIADAVAYLHERRIIFRDLKPSNIGFDNSDQILLFDFGLCRELPPECRARPYKYYPLMEEAEGEELEEYYASLDESWIDCSNYNDAKGRRQSLGGKAEQHQQVEEVYFMSGAGTQIYMAVEILINNRYNLKCDVYSWAMVVYEMLTLQKPFPLYSMEEHIQYVCKEGDRPSFEVQEHIPESLQVLLEAAWVGDVSERPSMATVCQQLQGIALETEEEAEIQEEADYSTLPHRLTYHVVETVSLVKQRLLAALGWTLESIISFFRRSREVETGLPYLQEDSATIEEKDAVAVSDEASASYTNMDIGAIPTKDEGTTHQESGTTTNSPLPEQGVKPLRHNRHALYKRNPSSASTTATTDDEFDEDDAIGGSYSSGMLKSIGSMEVVVERRAGSERSAA